MPSPTARTDALPLHDSLGGRAPEAQDGRVAGIAAEPPPWHAGRQLLIYQPDGPLGGTFSGTHCPAQAWQPDFQQHAPGCPLCPPPLPMTAG